MILAVVKPTIVLWVFFAASHMHNGVPMSRGWFSAYVYETIAECKESAKDMREDKFTPNWVVCLPATYEPEGPKGKILRKKGLEVSWPAEQKARSVRLLSQ